MFGYTYRLRLLLQPSDTIAPLEKPTPMVRVAHLLIL
jgi:hypothetical protein